MTNLLQFNRKTTFERLGLDVNQIEINLSEGLCFRFGIPRNERQLVTFFGGLSSSNNFEAILCWVHEQIIRSDAISEAELLDEIEDKFSGKIEQLY